MEKNLVKTTTRKQKRLGRGYGSGKGGHTVGRGQKGQKSRGGGGVNILFEGLKVKKSFIKRLPLMRGKGKFMAHPKPLIVKLSYLNLLPAGTKVDIDSLVKYKIVKESDARLLGVKILGDGKLEKKVDIALPISKSAAKAVIKVGGKILADSVKEAKN